MKSWRERVWPAHGTVVAGRAHAAGKESGIALLIVLLAITLLTIVVIEFTDAAQVETHLALSARNALQATYLARSAVNVAEALVIADAQLESLPNYQKGETVDDVWAGPFPPHPVGDGTFAFRVRDESRFLNFNDMLSGGSIQRDRFDVFRRLFTALVIDPKILNAIADWMDSDRFQYSTPGLSEETLYFGLTPPPRIRNQPLLTLRELLLVRGVTPSLLARLESFVTVLPPDRFRININTAPAEVLTALSDGTRDDPGVVERLIATRTSAPFSAPSEALRSVSGLDAALGGSREFLDTASRYFRIEAVGEIGDVRRGVVELVKRENKRLSRVTWTPSSATLALTSQPPSDFLATLPPLGGS